MESLNPENVLHGSDPEVLDILKSLGIPDPETCRKVVIEIDHSSVAVAYVERYIDKKGFKVIREVGKSFKVVEFQR